HAPALDFIYLDTYMRRAVYQKCGICVRNYRGAEPPRDLAPAGFVRTIRGRDRAPTADAAADRVKTPARAARGRLCGIHRGRTTASLSSEARTVSRGRGLVGSVPSILVGSSGCARTPSRPHGSEN